VNKLYLLVYTSFLQQTHSSHNMTELHHPIHRLSSAARLFCPHRSNQQHLIISLFLFVSIHHNKTTKNIYIIIIPLSPCVSTFGACIKKTTPTPYIKKTTNFRTSINPLDFVTKQPFKATYIFVEFFLDSASLHYLYIDVPNCLIPLSTTAGVYK
jgi:hypothetical protein